MSTEINNIFNGIVVGEVNSILTDIFAPDGIRCFLLRRAGETQRFSVIREIERGFLGEYDSFRGQMRFSIGSAEDLDDAFAAATDVAYGVPNEDGEMEVYSLGTGDARDIVSPIDGRGWRAFATKTRHERFTIPDPTPDPDPEP